MNPYIRILIFIINIISIDNLSDDYQPLYYPILKTLMITNPCYKDQSILIRNHSIYKFDREWKRLFISKKLFNTEVNSIAHFNNHLILIINGTLFQTQDVISSSTDPNIVYRLIRYSNVPILSNRIDYVFTTPSISCTFNDYVILANRSGYVMLFNMKSTTVVFDFGNLFQSQTICSSNPCVIQYLGLIRFQPILFCVFEYQPGKVIVYHQSFLENNSTKQKSSYINFTGDTLHITPSVIPNSYFFWDDKTIYYTPNAGQILAEVIPNGCQIDYLSNINEDQLKTYYTNLDIAYDNLTLVTKEIYCLNITIDYLVISQQEFFVFTKTSTSISSDVQWLYGKESFFPSMINVKSSCIRNQSIPEIDIECLNNQSYPCSPFVQSHCSYIRFEPLFDINQIYVLEKLQQQTWKFLLESYRTIPIMITSTKSNVFNYSINYNTNRLNNGIIQTIGSILVSTTNEGLDSNMFSLRIGLLQYGYSCKQTPSFSFQVEASCSPTSELRIEKTDEFDEWNQSRYINDIELLRQNLPTNILHQFSPVYIKRKQSDRINLKYHYCYNNTCQLLNHTQLDFFLIYAIPLDKTHEDYAHYLINRTDSCLPLNRLVYRLWIKSILNSKTRTQHTQILYERRKFYETLLNLLSISSKSCLFFNASNPIYINQIINRASEDYLKFILHIIAFDNQFSFCDLETFVLIEIEPIHNVENSYRGFIFLITIFLLILFFILLIHLYTYYKKQERNKYLKYHRLNQIDAGQFHQWYDMARYLNENRNTENYYSIQNALSNLESATSLFDRSFIQEYENFN